MPAIIAAMWGAFLLIIPSLVGRVLVSLSLSVITYVGMSSALGYLKDQAIANFHGLPADIVGMLAFMKVGVCISIIFSACLARLVLSGISSDTFKRWVHK